MKLAYWPGCVSRGFTPELHGSMARVAPLLDIELIELDRANCCGAGVIAEHNQELADTLNARTFALAQRTDGTMMMNICSTCQGSQSECQQRLDANGDYRDLIKSFQELPSKPKVYVCRPCPVPGKGNFGINEENVQKEIPRVDALAKELGCGVIDMHAALEKFPEMLPDRVHPNTAGAGEMAKAAAKAIAGK